MDGLILTFLVSMERARWEASENAYVDKTENMAKFSSSSIVDRFPSLCHLLSLWAKSFLVIRITLSILNSSRRHSQKNFEISCLYRWDSLSTGVLAVFFWKRDAWRKISILFESNSKSYGYRRAKKKHPTSFYTISFQRLHTDTWKWDALVYHINLFINDEFIGKCSLSNFII